MRPRIIKYTSRCALQTASLPGISVLLVMGCGAELPPVGEVSDRSPPFAPPGVYLPVELDCPTPLVRFADADGDGHGSASVQVEVCEETPGFVADDQDCDDLRADISPSALEICGDDIDHDCSGDAETCPEPDLDTDAAVVVQGDEDFFGTVIVGDLRTRDGDGPTAVMGAMNATGVTASDTDAGQIWEVGDAELLVPGATVALLDVEQGAVVGPRNSGLGRALAVADAFAEGDRSRLYAATGGPVQTAGGWSTCALFWFDEGVPLDGALVETASGVLPCDFLGDPDLTTGGLDTVAAGF
ncbi:MAG TPA: hypothetical protein DFR83_22460, partial [Deltaproteobacteria bacterium]|nr:hypothetical protein [Deltaproteobacteria bacterium]